MKKLYRMKETYLDELLKYAEKEPSANLASYLHDVSAVAKNLCKIIEAAEQEEEGGGESFRSMEGGSSRGSYRGRSYEGGGSSRSYEGGGSSYRRGRDSRGRYTSRDNGLKHKLEALAEEAEDEQTRRSIEQLVDQM